MADSKTQAMIYGKFVLQQKDGGRITSTAARGQDGKGWVESLLLLYGIMYGRVEFNRVVARAAKRLEKSEREEERRRRKGSR